jgi:hypothetical protein
MAKLQAAFSLLFPTGFFRTRGKKAMQSRLGFLCLIAIFGSLHILTARGETGGDLYLPSSTSTFQCLAGKGWDYVILNSYAGYGAVNPNINANLDAANAAGLQTDIFHSPCATQDAVTQINADINNVGFGNFGTMWIGIEDNPSIGCQWDSNLTANCQFLSDMISTAHQSAVIVGVYSSRYWWNSIVGSSCTAGNDAVADLWYANWNGAKNFTDFTPFGGWTQPIMKQYSDSVDLCGVLNAGGDWR